MIKPLTWTALLQGWGGHSLLGEREEKLDSFHSTPESMRKSVPSLSYAAVPAEDVTAIHHYPLAAIFLLRF